MPARDELRERARRRTEQGQVNDNYHGVFVRTYRERLCYHRCGHYGSALYRKNESRRRQDQNSQPASSNGLLWRVRFVHAPIHHIHILRSRLLFLHPLRARIVDRSIRCTYTGDTIQFAEFIERNIRLYHIRNFHPLRPQSAASWIRRSLAESLRSSSAYSVNLLIGGFDTADESPHLYWVDYLGTMASVPFAAHGYGSYFALGLLDR